MAVQLGPASLVLYAVMVGIEACPCERRGPTIHEFARLGHGIPSQFPVIALIVRKSFTTEARRSRRFFFLRGLRASVVHS